MNISNPAPLTPLIRHRILEKTLRMPAPVVRHESPINADRLQWTRIWN